MQNTYKSYSELKGNTLKCDDRVIFGAGREYIVYANHLCNDNGHNSEIFQQLNIVKEHHLADIVYGYDANRAGSWPSTKDNDYEALTRLVLVLFQFVEGKKQAEVCVDGKITITVTRAGICIIKSEKIKEIKNEIASKSPKVEVSIDFVKAAHEAACSEWKKKIEIEFPNIFEKEYEIGTRVILGTSSGNIEYMLVDVGDNQCSLINVKGGTLWNTPHMKGKLRKVTHSQLEEYIGKSVSFSIS
jgi:hypothetical protein